MNFSLSLLYSIFDSSSCFFSKGNSIRLYAAIVRACASTTRPSLPTNRIGTTVVDKIEESYDERKLPEIRTLQYKSMFAFPVNTGDREKRIVFN